MCWSKTRGVWQIWGNTRRDSHFCEIWQDPRDATFQRLRMKFGRPGSALFRHGLLSGVVDCTGYSQWHESGGRFQVSRGVMRCHEVSHVLTHRKIILINILSHDVMKYMFRREGMRQHAAMECHIVIEYHRVIRMVLWFYVVLRWYSVAPILDSKP